MTHLAVRYRHVEMLEMLLENSPSLSITNESELTALQIIDAPNQPPPPAKTREVKHGAPYPFSGDLDTIRALLASLPPAVEHPEEAVLGGGMLLDDEAELMSGDSCEEDGAPQRCEAITSVQELFWALRNNDTGLVQKALDSGQFEVNSACVPSDFPSDDPEHRWPYQFYDGEYGDTLLHLAVRYRYTAMVKLLLSFEPDLTLKNEAGQSIQDIATAFDESRSLPRSDSNMEGIWHWLRLAGLTSLGSLAWEFEKTKCQYQYQQQYPVPVPAPVPVAIPSTSSDAQYQYQYQYQ